MAEYLVVGTGRFTCRFFIVVVFVVVVFVYIVFVVIVFIVIDSSHLFPKDGRVHKLISN